MSDLEKYDYIWSTDKDKYVLIDDDFEKSILCVNEKKVVFVLLEDDTLTKNIIDNMLKSGNKTYNSINELQIELQRRNNE